MGLWIATVKVDTGIDRAGLFDSVTERPVSVPLFSDVHQAEDFVEFCELSGYPSVRALGPDTLAKLYAMWTKQCEEDRHVQP